MKISLDGGAICTNNNLHFGNYTFTKNLIEAIQKYDKENEYFVYSFCARPDWINESNKLKYKLLKPRTLWLSTRVGFEEIREKKNIFLALNQAIPLKTSKKVISFSHGLSFYFYPKFYPDSYHALKDQLEPMVKRSDYVVVASRKVKIELKKLFPGYQNFVTINYGTPFNMLKFNPRKRKKYFMFVGMNHPIKNIDFIIKAFKELKKFQRFKKYKLFLVGNLKNFEEKRYGIYVLAKINREDLKIMYSEATASLTASFYESFNFPVIESLSQQCPVVGLKSAIIPEFSDLVCTADNFGDFVKKMMEICKTKKIKDYRKEITDRFSWEKYIKKLIELFKS